MTSYFPFSRLEKLLLSVSVKAKVREGQREESIRCFIAAKISQADISFLTLEVTELRACLHVRVSACKKGTADNWLPSPAGPSY